MRKYILESIAGSTLEELSWRRVLVEAGILLGLVATASWLTR